MRLYEGDTESVNRIEEALAPDNRDERLLIELPYVKPELDAVASADLKNALGTVLTKGPPP